MSVIQEEVKATCLGCSMPMKLRSYVGFHPDAQYTDHACTGSVPSLPRAEIESIEREHFPELFEICHTPVLPKPAILQALWANCTDYK